MHAPDQLLPPAARPRLKQGRPSPAPQGRRLADGVGTEGIGKIELAAVAWPPAMFDGMRAQARRDAVPVLADGAEIAYGSCFTDFLMYPELRCRLDHVGF